MGARKLLYHFVPFLPNDYCPADPLHTELPNTNINPNTEAVLADGDYRYGFNGMEKYDEITGVEGSHLDFGARIYDSRVGRWLSVDPKYKLQPNWSPYKAFYDNPTLYIDPEGEIKKINNSYIRRSTTTIMLVNWDGLKRSASYVITFPTHYVIYMGKLEIDGDNVSFDVMTWGMKTITVYTTSWNLSHSLYGSLVVE